MDGEFRKEHLLVSWRSDGVLLVKMERETWVLLVLCSKSLRWRAMLGEVRASDAFCGVSEPASPAAELWAVAFRRCHSVVVHEERTERYYFITRTWPTGARGSGGRGWKRARCFASTSALAGAVPSPGEEPKSKNGLRHEDPLLQNVDAV